MFSTLRKLEMKLSYIDMEDLYTLTLYTSDSKVIKHLQKFIIQYIEFYNISDIFKDNATKKQYFIIVLIQRLYETISWVKTTYLPNMDNEMMQREFPIKRKCKLKRFSFSVCFSELLSLSFFILLFFSLLPCLFS
jgi:hypothetical protein